MTSDVRRTFVREPRPRAVGVGRGGAASGSCEGAAAVPRVGAAVWSCAGAVPVRLEGAARRKFDKKFQIPPELREKI